VAARSWRGRVEVAGAARIGRGVRISVAPGGRLRVGRGCRLGDGCRLVVLSGEIDLGAGTVLGDGCTLIAKRDVTIGPGSRLGDGVSILDFGPDPIDVERPIRRQPLHVARVVLGPAVEVGLRARIGPGVRLPASARVAPGVVLERTGANSTDVRSDPCNNDHIRGVVSGARSPDSERTDEHGYE
jgi:acetyltransferase-like isoleucine patch superfamily enzyme